MDRKVIRIVLFVLCIGLLEADNMAYTFSKECECTQLNSSRDFCMAWSCQQWIGDKDQTNSGCFAEN